MTNVEWSVNRGLCLRRSAACPSRDAGRADTGELGGLQPTSPAGRLPSSVPYADAAEARDLPSRK
jgi:hypothetical protein